MHLTGGSIGGPKTKHFVKASFFHSEKMTCHLLCRFHRIESLVFGRKTCSLMRLFKLLKLVAFLYFHDLMLLLVKITNYYFLTDLHLILKIFEFEYQMVHLTFESHPHQLLSSIVSKL